MGMESKLLLWGPYSEAVRNLLEYPKEYYRNVNNGSVVFTTMYQCSSNGQSEILLQLFKINGFNGCYFNNYQLKTALNEMDPFLVELLEQETDESIDDLKILSKAGFQMYCDFGF